MKNILAGLAAAPLALTLVNAPVYAADITVAGGCFWCIEADYEKLDGVSAAVSGFTGGTVANPTYKQVTGGGTGHYEAVRITYDPAKLSLDDLYTFFFHAIDPTDAGGQFCDRGDSYRSAIFVHSADQKAAAEAAKAKAERELGQSIVTPIVNASTFYAADSYHQDYYKSDRLVVTRFGPLAKKNAYQRYRDACGRDDRLQDLWGASALTTGG